MPQQYGFRAASNLSEILNRNDCWDNLGFDRRDLALLVNTAASGVDSSDYQAIINLSSSLEDQVVAALSGSAAAAAIFAEKINKNGDSFIGNIQANIVNNDRPFVDAANIIYGPSTASYFSPTASGDYATGAEYKLGSVRTTTLTVSGVNYRGIVSDWSDYYIRYKQYLSIGEQPSWTTRRSPLYLAPPSIYASNKIWLDSEHSSFNLDGSNGVVQWRDVLGRSIAQQDTSASRPIYTTNLLNGKPGIVFDGSNDSLSFGNISSSFPNAATIVVVVSIGESVARGDSDFNIFSTLNNISTRWRTGSGNGSFGTFSSTILNDFPRNISANGTLIFTVQASQQYGIELRINGSRYDFLSNRFTNQFTYNAGSEYRLGANANASAGFFTGTMFAFAAFDTLLSTKELRSIEEYFAWRYDFVYDPDRSQPIELEDGQPLQTEGSISFILG